MAQKVFYDDDNSHSFKLIFPEKELDLDSEIFKYIKFLEKKSVAFKHEIKKRDLMIQREITTKISDFEDYIEELKDKSKDRGKNNLKITRTELKRCISEGENRLNEILKCLNML